MYLLLSSNCSCLLSSCHPWNNPLAWRRVGCRWFRVFQLRATSSISAKKKENNKNESPMSKCASEIEIHTVQLLSWRSRHQAFLESRNPAHASRLYFGHGQHRHQKCCLLYERVALWAPKWCPCVHDRGKEFQLLLVHAASLWWVLIVCWMLLEIVRLHHCQVVQQIRFLLDIMRERRKGGDIFPHIPCLHREHSALPVIKFKSSFICKSVNVILQRGHW